MPDGWTATTIGQHADVLTGFAFKSADYTSNEDDVKLLRGDNVAPHRLRWRDVKRFPKERANEVSRYQLRAGDFVVAMDRTWLPSGVKIAEVAQADLPCLLVQRVARLRAKDTLHQGLMKQFFSGHQFDQHVQAVQTETAVPHISPADLRDYPIKLPPMHEQRRIAEMLSTWDYAIETVAALITNARTQKQALMQSLLTGTKRLPGFSGAWTTQRLESFCQISKGEQLGRLAMIEAGTIPVINGGISASGYTDRANTPSGCITISEGGNSCGFVSIIHQPFWCGGHCYALKDLTVDRSFLFAALKHREAEIMTLRVGSGLPNIQKKALSGFELLVPPRDEQEAIGKCADVQSDAIQGLENQLSCLRQEKSALMQQLLTGKRRVKVAEGAVA